MLWLSIENVTKKAGEIEWVEMKLTVVQGDERS